MPGPPPKGAPPARPMQANSRLRNISPHDAQSPRAPPPGAIAPPRVPPGMPSPRNAAAIAAASSLLESSTMSSPGAAAPPPPQQDHIAVPGRGFGSTRGFKGDLGTADKRMNVFKTRFTDDARETARRIQLLDLVKMLSSANIRQAEEIENLRVRQRELEKRLETYRPLEGLLHFMAGSDDSRLVSMLAPPPKKGTLPRRTQSATSGMYASGLHDPSQRRGNVAEGVAAPGDAGVKGGEGMPLPEPGSLQTAREVSERILSLMRLCGDGEGVSDEGLLQQVRDVEGVMRGIRPQGSYPNDRVEYDDDQYSNATSDPPGTPSTTGWVPQGAASFQRAGSDGRTGSQGGWNNEAEAEMDPFAAEIQAVGTEVQKTCKVCAMVFFDSRNNEAACRFHPGGKRIDSNWNSLFSCCGAPMTARGCMLGPHVPTENEDQDRDDDTAAS